MKELELVFLHQTVQCLPEDVCTISACVRREDTFVRMDNDSMQGGNGTRLYVGSLPYTTTDDQLKDHFASAGSVVSAHVIIDKMSGRSKGFGFVEMATKEDAQKAIEMFNGSDMGGRSIVVNEARPMEARAPRGGGFGGGRGGF